VHRYLLPSVALVLIACGDGVRHRPVRGGGASASVSVPGEADPERSSSASAYPWYGIYNYDQRQPTFRPCGYGLALTLHGNDSLLALLAAKIDFQAARPVLRVMIEAAGDTARPDPQAPPVFTITGVGQSHTPQAGECAPQGPTLAPPLREAALRTAMAAAGIAGGSPRTASAYIDGDDRADAVVLLTSGPTCNPAGCDLWVFRGTPDGTYVPVSRTQHVKPPVSVREARNDGSRMLLVGVGQGGGFRDRDARLAFRSGRGYPIDAMVEPPAFRDPNALLLIAP